MSKWHFLTITKHKLPLVIRLNLHLPTRTKVEEVYWFVVSSQLNAELFQCFISGRKQPASEHQRGCHDDIPGIVFVLSWLQVLMDNLCIVSGVL